MKAFVFGSLLVLISTSQCDPINVGDDNVDGASSDDVMNRRDIKEGPDVGSISDEKRAMEWVMDSETLIAAVSHQDAVARWNYYTNLTDYNDKQMMKVHMESGVIIKEIYHNASLFDWENFQNETLKRMFQKLQQAGISILSEDKIYQMKQLMSKMERIYGTAKACRDESGCMALEPELTAIMAKHRDWEKLEWAWRAWRDASGKFMGAIFADYMELSNEAARLNGFKDQGDYFRAAYEMENFEEEVARIWAQVKPFYKELHAYARRKLQSLYKDHPFPESGHIPAHILGNMWAQQWTNLQDVMMPYDNEAVNITRSLLEQKYDVHALIKLTEEFFTSLGFSALPETFWNRSMLEKPVDGREVVCHASAWDFHDGKDYRIKQCTEINNDWLVKSHHEMGHIMYFIEYKDLPTMFRDGANPGFHEALGDLIALSVSTPVHMQKIGLVDVFNDTPETAINYLMYQALSKIAFLPFGYIIDLWRWAVADGRTPVHKYNRDWWKLRCEIQGVSPPVERFEEDFDPGSKFHVAGGVPYVRYFVSTILQFQFHEALCKEAGHKGPLHQCDIYRSKEAGEKLRKLLKLGASAKWPDALESITGSRDMDPGPMLEYFRPLQEWLEKENEGSPVGWDSDCPAGMVAMNAYLPHSSAAFTRQSEFLLVAWAWSFVAWALSKR